MLVDYNNTSNANEVIHFLHANGYPPCAYDHILSSFDSDYLVKLSILRPLWENIGSPNFTGWDLFVDDYLNSIENEENIIGIGHSIGANILLKSALYMPEKFTKLILLDPTLFIPIKIKVWKILRQINCHQYLSPLIKAARNKRMTYNSFDQIFENYRKKNIFSKLNDKALSDYIDSIIIDNDNGVEIKLSQKWENSIYRNGSIHDYWIWKNIKGFNIPIYVITPENNEFGHFNYGRLLKSRNNNFINLTIKDSSHLFPLEKPDETAQLITSNINF